MKTARIIVLMASAAIIGLVVYLVIGDIQRMPVIGFVLVAVLGLVALLCVVYVAYVILNRINKNYHHMESRKLARQAELKRLEFDQLMIEQAEREEQLKLERAERAEQVRWEREQMRWEREQAREDERVRQEALLEQRRLELEEQRIKLQAYQAQAVHVGRDQTLIIRDYSGLNTKTAYEPAARRVREEYPDTELVTDPAIEQLAAPRRYTVSALALLQGGELTGDDVVLGVGADGQIVRRTWRQLMSILILGLMGGGKTNTALWIVLQLIVKGYRVALIDRHAKSDESTHARLKGFSHAYDTPVGDSVVAASRVVKHVRQVFESRRDQGAPIDYKLVFICDEFTATMRAATDKTSDWQDVAIALAGLVEDLNSEGRKYGVHVIAMGQAANASRGGGTEVRDLFHSRIIHGMRARQAQMLGMTDEKHAIQKLETGQVYVDIEGKDDPFPMQVPEVTADFTTEVLRRIAPRRTSPKLVLKDTFDPRSVWGQNDEPNRSTVSFEQPMNTVPNTPEPITLELPEKAKRVLDLRKSGMGKAAIILEIWQAKKGGSAAYKQATEEYTQIVENLVTLGYLVAQ
jgi:hypothetical protein